MAEVAFSKDCYSATQLSLHQRQQQLLQLQFVHQEESDANSVLTLFVSQGWGAEQQRKPRKRQAEGKRKQPATYILTAIGCAGTNA